MNKFLALGLGSVLFVAAAGLFVAGQVVLAVTALIVSFVFDLLFVMALRNQSAQHTKT